MLMIGSLAALAAVIFTQAGLSLPAATLSGTAPVAAGRPGPDRLILHLTVDTARRTLADEPAAATGGAFLFLSRGRLGPYVEASISYAPSLNPGSQRARRGPLRYQVSPRVELTVGKIVTSVGGGVLYAFSSGVRLGIGTNFMKVPGMPSAIQILAPLSFRF